jgi:C1A family cysteine protease
MKIMLKYIFSGAALIAALLASSCSLTVSSGGSAAAGSPKLHPLGAKFDTIPAAKTLLRQAISGLGPLPSSVDLSTNGYLPPIGNQEDVGSCVAWATGYYLLTYDTARANAGWSPASASGEFSPSWIYNQISGGADNGSYPEDAMVLITADGCDTLADFPYYSSNFIYTKPSAASFAAALPYAPTSWEFLSLDTNTIRSVLASGQCVMIAIEVYTPDFDTLDTNGIYDSTNAFTNYEPSVWGAYSNSNFRGGHGICLVGYDDSKQAFKFVNQWGTTYGISGYGWITYGFLNSVIKEAVTFD